MTLTCHNCKKPGHKRKYCKQLMEKSDKSSNVENGTRKWCSYHDSNGHTNKDCYEQQSESTNSHNKKGWCSHHKSGSHSDDQCYHQGNGSHNSPADGKSTKNETFVAGSDVTGCDKCSCNRKVKSKCTEIDDGPNNTSPGVGFSSAMCYPPLLQEADGFQLLVDSGSSKHFIDPEFIRGVGLKSLEHTKTEPPMEITAVWNNVLRGTVQGIFLVVVHGIDEVLRTVKLRMCCCQVLKGTCSPVLAAAKKSVKTAVEMKGSSFDLGAFSVQLTRLDSMDYLDLTIAKERRTESALCAISRKILVGALY